MGENNVKLTQLIPPTDCFPGVPVEAEVVSPPAPLDQTGDANKGHSYQAQPLLSFPTVHAIKDWHKKAERLYQYEYCNCNCNAQ